MYKRHLSTILLAGIMTASILAGCGSQTAGTGQETSVSAEQDTSEDTPQEEPAASEQDTLAEEDGNEEILMIAKQGMFSSGGTVTEPVEGDDKLAG